MTDKQQPTTAAPAYALLVRILVSVANEPIFARKGGTAINLFYRDLARLVLAIDLTDLPIKDRTASVAGFPSLFMRNGSIAVGP